MNNFNFYGALKFIIGGLFLAIVGYFTSMINVGGYTLKIFIALPFIGVILFLWGLVILIIQLFYNKLWYGIIGLVIGIGVIVSLGFGAYNMFFLTEFEKQCNRLNSKMITINPFHDTRISISVPKTMVKEKNDYDEGAFSEYEEYYNANDDILRISVERILKSNVNDFIFDLSDFVAILQAPRDSLDKTKYYEDTSIKCVADENGYNVGYYTFYKSPIDYRIIYVEDKEYFLILKLWNVCGHSNGLKDLNDKIIKSFNIKK